MTEPSNPYATEPLTDAGRIEEQGENPPMQTIRDWLNSQAAPDAIANARMQAGDDAPEIHVHGTPGGPFVPIPGHPEFIARHEIPEGMTPPQIEDELFCPDCDMAWTQHPHQACAATRAPRFDDTQAGVEAATIARMNELAAELAVANPPPAPLEDAPLHPAAEDYARHMLEPAGIWDELPPVLRSRAIESANSMIRAIEGSAPSSDPEHQWRLVRADQIVTPEQCRGSGGHYWGPLVNGRRNECVRCGFLGYTYKGN